MQRWCVVSLSHIYSWGTQNAQELSSVTAFHRVLLFLLALFKKITDLILQLVLLFLAQQLCLSQYFSFCIFVMVEWFSSCSSDHYCLLEEMFGLFPGYYCSEYNLYNYLHFCICSLTTVWQSLKNELLCQRVHLKFWYIPLKSCSKVFT